MFSWCAITFSLPNICVIGVWFLGQTVNFLGRLEAMVEGSFGGCCLLLLVSQVAGNLRAVNCFLSLFPCFFTFSSFPAWWCFPYMPIQNMLAVKMQWDTISNTLLQFRCIILIFQLHNAVRRVDWVSLERFLLLKLLFIAWCYTACLILEIYFFFPSS